MKLISRKNQPLPNLSKKKTKFIHDLANSLAVVDLHTIRLLKMLSENQSEKELEVTKKLEAQIKKMITLVQRTKIFLGFLNFLPLPLQKLGEDIIRKT